MYRTNCSNFNDKFLVPSGFNPIKPKWLYDRFDLAQTTANTFSYSKSNSFFFSAIVHVWVSIKLMTFLRYYLFVYRHFMHTLLNFILCNLIDMLYVYAMLWEKQGFNVMAWYAIIYCMLSNLGRVLNILK